MADLATQAQAAIAGHDPYQARALLPQVIDVAHNLAAAIGEAKKAGQLAAAAGLAPQLAYWQQIQSQLSDVAAVQPSDFRLGLAAITHDAGQAVQNVVGAAAAPVKLIVVILGIGIVLWIAGPRLLQGAIGAARGKGA